MKAVIGEKIFKGIPALLLLVFVVVRSCACAKCEESFARKKIVIKKHKQVYFSFYEFF